MGRLFPLLAVGALLLGCGDRGPTGPYFVPLATPGQGNAPITRGPTTVSLCYNSTTTSPERIREMVAENCEGAELLSNRYDIGVCALAVPTRALYQCQRISSTLAEERPPLLPSLTK